MYMNMYKSCEETYGNIIFIINWMAKILALEHFFINLKHGKF